MKINNTLFVIASFLLSTVMVFAQRSELQYFRYNDARGLNVFETGKEDTVEFDGVAVRVGGDFALQFQGISQSNTFTGDSLVELSNNFNLPTANLNLDVQMYDGLRLHMRVYLSSRHHPEAWVKGGYIQMDKLDFIRKDFLSGFMSIATLRFGMDEINYGDTHFRRSDNARAIFNPFVGNYIMDAFTTEPFGEITLQKNGLLFVGGITNGRLNQSPTPGDDGLAFYSKLGYDNQLSEDLRVRLTGSIYSSTVESTRDYLYNGDRAGGRYYNVMVSQAGGFGDDFQPRFNTGFPSQTAIQINPFVKFKGLEFFGVYEIANNGGEDANGDAIGGGYTQLGAEAIYRFANDKLYFGGRFNSVNGQASETALDRSISRLNVGGGWFLTENIVTKVEYVTSSYSGDGFTGQKEQGAEFSGLVIEAAISF